MVKAIAKGQENKEEEEEEAVYVGLPFFSSKGLKKEYFASTKKAIRNIINAFLTGPGSEYCSNWEGDKENQFKISRPKVDRNVMMAVNNFNTT